MARVLAFIPDLLFGSNVVGALGGAGHQVQLLSAVDTGGVHADVLVVDLTADPTERIAAVKRLGADRPPVLAFYSHVETEVRAEAEQAGFELVVPRSRMAREGTALVERLASR